MEDGNLPLFTVMQLGLEWQQFVRQTVNVRHLLAWEESIKVIKLAVLWNTLHSLLWNHLHGLEQTWSLLPWLPVVLKQESQTVQLKA